VHTLYNTIQLSLSLPYVGHIDISLFNISIIERRNTLIIIDISSYYAKLCGGCVDSFVRMAVKEVPSVSSDA
jgi:hypothetical protein